MPIVSTSCNRILANHSNAVREAVIVASAQRPSTDVRLIAEARSGGGRVVVAGAYTGAADTEIDVEVLSGTGGALSASTPLINGVGNGALTIEAIRPAAVPETIIFSLLHAGDPADPAVLEFAGTTIAARTPGAAGNAITLGVVRDLTATPTQYSTLEPITNGQAEFDGPAWDWGHPPATDAGIPLAALRIQFEGYPTVHRAWKVWDAGRFLYKLDPAPAWDIPADTRVLAITGDYTLTLTDGVSPEVYTAVTVHDFLSAVASRSALVEVLGVIALDRAPGGMAITDIPLRTDAHALPPVMTVKSTLVRGLVDVTVAPAAPTENITITHAGRGAGGADVWAVRGAVSGDLPDAQTGVPYAAGPVGFTVPNIVAPGGVRARISANVVYEPRAEGEGLPAICFKPLVLGALASDKSVTFTYRKRPPADCVCEKMPALRLSGACLGVADGGSDMALDTEYQTRLVALYEWQHLFVSGNVGFSAALNERRQVEADAVDIQVAQGAVSILAGALAEIYATSAAADQWDDYFTQLQDELEVFAGMRGTVGTSGRQSVEWAPELTLNVGEFVRPTARNGRLYLVIAAGTLADDVTGEPDWATETTSPVTSGTVSMEILPPYWTATTAVAEGDVVEPGNGYRYRATAAGTTDSSEPYWAVSGADITDGTVVWSPTLALSGQALGGSADYDGDVPAPGVTPAEITIKLIETGGSPAYFGYVIVTSGPWAGFYKNTGGGTQTSVEATATWLAARMAYQYGTTEPTANTALRAQRLAEAIAEVEPYYDRYRTAMDHCRTLAGIVPKSDASTAAGDGCWRDYPDETHWWVDESGEYLPAFNNKPYVSVSRDAEGEIYSTREFGFGIVTPCAHRLKSGDKFTIQIRGAANAYTYGDGDKFVIPVIAAAPLAFTGGADGDPTQTWTVRGTTSGALPDWLYNPAAPSDYDDAASPVVVSLAAAGIPFEQGDSIRLALEGGTMRWRRDAGSWTTVNLFGATHSLGDGLTLQAVAGAAPSFVTGDAWSFQALATYGVSRLRQPRIGRGYAFDGTGAVLDIDLGAVLDLEAVLIALHTLPNTATLAISGGDAAIGEWTAAPTVRPGAILAALPAGTSARYLRLTIAGTVTGASIGWIWAGLGWQPTVGASDLTMARQYGIARGAGLNPAGLYRGRGNGGRWSWQIDQGGALMDSNVDALLELVDHVAAQGLEPVCITPDLREPARASLAILDADEIVMVEHNNWQGSGRAVSVDLPFRAVLA